VYSQHQTDHKWYPGTMRQFTEGGTPEKTIKESKEDEPDQSEEPWLALNIRDLKSDQGRRDKHDGRDGETGVKVSIKEELSRSETYP
jgi:hypothetical protein